MSLKNAWCGGLGDLLPYEACRPFINWYRAKEGSELSYIDLQAVSDEWYEKTVRETTPICCLTKRVGRSSTGIERRKGASYRILTYRQYLIDG